ncbi:alkylmercury lyase [Streptomyces sp. NPDC003023]|uniref:alkylmercury lyase n=1 Tax=Streptomyces sp. NPDC003023 TaxID=3364675 RepID=UPI0036C5614F
MELTVLAVPDCPNVALLLHRLAQVLPEFQGPGTVPVRLIVDEAEAARSGMHGSPTLLVDGRDPFASPGAATGVSCRLYRDADGRVEGAPGLEPLREALGGGFGKGTGHA